MGDIWPSNVPHEGDVVVWKGTTTGNFSIKSAYAMLSGYEGNRRVGLWKAVWDWKGPARMQSFMWLVLHEAILTNAERHRRHISPFAVCGRCWETEESILHALRNCHASREIWEQLLTGTGFESQFFYYRSTQQWVINNMHIEHPQISGHHWGTVRSHLLVIMKVP